VNGDGIADLMIGAPGARTTTDGSAEGAIFVVFGKTAGFAAEIDLSSLDGTNGFRIDGAAGSVAGAGDVNGDGIADLVSAAGSTYVVFGTVSGFPKRIDVSSLDGANGFRIDGMNTGAWSNAGAGDVNGDGFADLVIGAFLASPNGKDNAGSTYVVFGTASGFPKRINVSSLDGTNGFRIDGATTSARSGWSVAGGDVNGDGVADLIIGAPGGNRSYTAKTFVVYGRR
jgi:hypothetical protein